ncbi:hypothetical protein [Leptolyngbya sp. Cla-17]|uniref:hypothetical protein n=1 Tax=Leptolyngbya sp. Cla-17 TaxID=2803751 RepID=UPI0014921FA7|nr:hypothetical protein [Leptolyngbya sp. Cla-17]
MQVLFQKLLKHSDGWNQTQKEAMVDLCLLGMYSDDLISLAEQDFIENESTQLKWESGISFSGYLQRTIPKIRSAKVDSQKVEDLLQNISERLGSDELKRKASSELEKLLASDEVVKLEEEFLSKVQKVMGI